MKLVITNKGFWDFFFLSKTRFVEDGRMRYVLTQCNVRRKVIHTIHSFESLETDVKKPHLI